MPRGGRRPGTGARKGNVNALKTGKHSLRAQRAIEAIVASPEGLAALARLAMRGERPTLARKRAEGILVAEGLTPFDLVEREKRLVHRMRRIRAMLTARIERDERRRNSWRTMLDEERVRLAAHDVAESAGEKRAEPNRNPASKRSENRRDSFRSTGEAKRKEVMPPATATRCSAAHHPPGGSR
jgi:hypothetical protein